MGAICQILRLIQADASALIKELPIQENFK